MSRLFLTPARQATLTRIYTEGHPWWDRILAWANDATAPVADRAVACATAFQTSGIGSYARTGWSLLEPAIRAMTPPANSNETREHFITYVWTYDWIRDALTNEERAAYIAWLNQVGDLVLNHVAALPWGTNTSDSDDCTGHYFGLALLDTATVGDNPRAGTFLTSTWPDGDVSGPVKPVGGLDATGSNRDTMRNTIRQYADMAAGGTWIEGSHYNVGTLKLVALGAEGVRTATGVDHFPEVTALLPEFVLGMLQQLTPDTKDAYQWGDIQQPHDLRMYHRWPLLCILAGLDGAEPFAAFAQEWVQETLPALSTEGFDPRALAFYDPWAEGADWRVALALSKSYLAPGQGLAFLRTGWEPGASFFGVQTQPVNNVDHPVCSVGDFQLYRRGEWVITHPVSYGGVGTDQAGLLTNSMLVAGLTAMPEARGMVAQEMDPEGRWVYHAGATAGVRAFVGEFEPPPTFLHEWTRQVVYLPGPVDHIVVYDRVNAEDPRDLPDLSYYPANVQALIEAAPHLKEWVLHMPVPPVVAPDGFAWATPGGQTVRVTPLVPEDWRWQVYDERVSGLPGLVDEAEKKWHARIAPASDRQWDTFLVVIQVGDNAIPPTLLSEEGREGVAIHREGKKDTAVLFGSAPGEPIPPTQPVNDRAVYNPELLSLLSAKVEHEIKLGDDMAAVTIPTDASGTATFAVLAKGTYTYTVAGGQEYEDASGTVSVQGVTALSVTMKKKNSLVLQAFDENGVPIAGLAVTVTPAA